MKIGIVGYHGRLGSQLVHDGCDPLDYDILSKKKLDWDGNVVINCAALTDVDRAEEPSYYQRAIQVNSMGVAYLASNFSGRIIHISTDYVFGGKRGPYDENYHRSDDLPTDKMGYSIAKYAGEICASIYNNVKIVRTAGLYGGVSGKPDFVYTLLKAFEANVQELKIPKDLFGNQTYIPHLSKSLIMCAELSNIPSILHIASENVVSRYEFALMIANVFQLDRTKIKPVRSNQVSNFIAERPRKAGLKVKLAKKLGIPIYSILEGLHEYKNEYNQCDNSLLQ